jgi:hypothetical protein
VFGFNVTPAVIQNNTFEGVTITSYALSVVTTVLSTVIIVIRILKVSRLPGATHQSRMAVEIIIESAALYSISALVYVPMLSPLIPSATVYYKYGEIFFAYMAVESHLSYHTVLI